VSRRAAWKGYAAGSEVAHFADFCREHLVQSEDRWEGRPLVLEAWQRRMLGEALAFDEEGLPVWRSVVIVAPRKTGKTSLLAALAVYRLVTSAGRPEILLAASSDKQAGRLFDAAARFVRRSPELRRLVRVRDHAGELVREDGMGIVYRLSSDPARLHGYNPTVVVVDELAQWTTPTLRRAYAALTSGGGARQAPQVWTITTAGEASERHDSILGRLLDAVGEDAEREPGLTVGRIAAAQTLVWAFEAPTNDPHDVGAMKLANPASWITKAYLARQAEDPELTDAQVLQLHGCVWAAGETTWISLQEWLGCIDRKRRLLAGERLVLGFDGSERRDSTALVACTLDGFVAPIRVWERPARAPSEWRIPRPEVHGAVAIAFEAYDVAEFSCDLPGWYSEVDEWSDLYPGRVVEFTTGRPQKMAPACDRFRAGVFNRTLTHNGDAILTAHVANAVARETLHGTAISKDHPDSPRKIDAAVAAVVAFDRVAWHAQRPTEPAWGVA